MNAAIAAAIAAAGKSVEFYPSTGSLRTGAPSHEFTADAYKPRRRSKGEKARNRKGRWS